VEKPPIQLEESTLSS